MTNFYESVSMMILVVIKLIVSLESIHILMLVFPPFFPIGHITAASGVVN